MGSCAVQGYNTGIAGASPCCTVWATGHRSFGRDLPGCPDMVLYRSGKKNIFVHGCYWHRHDGCANARIPKSRIPFWREKLEGNRVRDIQNQGELDRLGWRSFVIWECELKDLEGLKYRISTFLEGEGELR